MLWLLFLFTVATATIPDLIFQVPPSDTVHAHRHYPFFYGIEGTASWHDSLYAVVAPSHIHVSSFWACSDTSSNMRNEILRLNTTVLQGTSQTDTLVRFYDQAGCQGESSYVQFQGDLCRTFGNNVAVYFQWRSVLVPPRSTATFRTASSNLQCRSDSDYDTVVWTLANSEDQPLCLARPSATTYAYHVQLTPHRASIFMERVVLSPDQFFDDTLQQNATMLPNVSPHLKSLHVHRNALFLLMDNTLRCTATSSALLRFDLELGLEAVAKLDNTVVSPLTQQPVAYHHTPVETLFFREMAWIVYYDGAFAPLVAHHIGNLTVARHVYFRHETVVSGETQVSFVSRFSKALLVEATAWLFTDDEVVRVDLDVAIGSLQHNVTYERIPFSEGWVHSVAYDDRKRRVYAMVHSRLFSFDALTAQLLEHSSCGRAKEYDSTWGLSGPLSIDAVKGHGYLFPSGSIQRFNLRDLALSGGDGTYFVDEQLRNALRRGQSDTMHIQHANVSVLGNGLHVVGVHPVAFDFQPPILLVYHEPGCARGRAGSNCDLCGTGRYSNQEGAVRCNECPHGRISTDNESVGCTPCPLGTYRTSTTGCEDCSFGTYADQTGMESCKECPLDTFHMQSGSMDANDCLMCPAGKITTHRGASSCDECPVGRIKSTLHPGQCEACSVGLYRAVGQVACQECPLGQFGRSPGLASKDDCEECPGGTYGNGNREIAKPSTACLSCPAGKTSEPGNEELEGCSNCPLGTTTHDGDAQCTACRAGQYTKVPGTACALCPKGKINRQNGSVTCESCEMDSDASFDRTRCVCVPGFYGVPHMEEGGSGCTPCPTGAICPRPQVEHMELEPGFWRVSNLQTTLLRCKEFHACQGGQWNQTCRQGHHGPLCHVCKPGYAKSDGLCAICPPEQLGLNIFVSILAPVVLLLILVLLIRSANPEDGQVDPFSGVSKIATSYLQVYSLCYQFDVKWPPLVRQLFEVSDYVNPTISFYSADCSFQWTFYDRLWFYLLMPPIYVVAVVVVLYGLERYYKRPLLHRWLYPSVVVGIFLAYPSLIKTFMRVLSCDKIGDAYYLSTDYAVPCYTDEHRAFSIASSVALVLYGLGFPLKACLVLWHYRHRLYEPLPKTMHFLYNGYRLYYWEFVILSRKIAVVSMSVFLFRQSSVRYQAIAVSWLLQAYFILHLKLAPFDVQTVYGRMCDRLEWMGLLSTLITINAGVVFGTTQDDYELSDFENVLLVGVVVVNVVVFFVFLYYLLLTGSKKALSKILTIVSMGRWQEKAEAFVAKSEEEKREDVLVQEGKEDAVQLEIELTEMRHRGSTVVPELERLHHEIETMHAKQKFEWKKYTSVCRQVRRLQGDEGALDTIKALFDHEQQQHLKWLQDTLRSPRNRAASI